MPRADSERGVYVRLFCGWVWRGGACGGPIRPTKAGNCLRGIIGLGDPADAGTLDAALAAVAWAIEDRQAHGYILVLNSKSGSGRSSLGFATEGANSSRPLAMPQEHVEGCQSAANECSDVGRSREKHWHSADSSDLVTQRRNRPGESPWYSTAKLLRFPGCSTSPSSFAFWRTSSSSLHRKLAACANVSP
jgi:hypothetical protein